MDWFNAGVRIDDLLEQYCYERSPRNDADLGSRYQNSGSYATGVIGGKWVSLSTSDAAEGVGAVCKAGCYGDAYDLFVHYEHRGDHRAA